MYGQQRPVHQFKYSTSPYDIPVYGTVSSRPVQSDANWYNTWPNVKSIILSVTMLTCSATIIGLDIANTAIEVSKHNGTSHLGSGTGKVGAGIWSGSISFCAAIFIIMISK